MKRLLTSVLLGFSSLGFVSAEDGPLKIEHAWIIAVPPAASATAAFMVLTNTGDVPLKIVSAKTAIAASAEPMLGTKVMKDGQEMSGMESVPVLVIPAHGTRKLKPGGDHLMLIDLKTHPKVGDVVTLTLQIEPGRLTRELKVPVAFQAPKP